MLYGVASIRDAAGADRLTFRVARVGVRGAGALLPASSAARGGADVGAPCHPSRDRVILLSILTYTFCVRLVCRRTRRGRRSRARSSLDRLPCGAACADTRTPGTAAIGRIADCRLGSRGWREFPRCADAVGRDSILAPGSRAVARPGYARGQVTKARTTISSYRNIDASAASPPPKHAYALPHSSPSTPSTTNSNSLQPSRKRSMTKKQQSHSTTPTPLHQAPPRQHLTKQQKTTSPLSPTGRLWDHPPLRGRSRRPAPQHKTNPLNPPPVGKAGFEVWVFTKGGLVCTSNMQIGSYCRE